MEKISENDLKVAGELLDLVRTDCDGQFEGLPVSVALLETLREEIPATDEGYVDVVRARLKAYVILSEAIDGMYTYILKLEARIAYLENKGSKFTVN